MSIINANFQNYKPIHCKKCKHYFSPRWNKKSTCYIRIFVKLEFIIYTKFKRNLLYFFTQITLNYPIFKIPLYISIHVQTKQVLLYLTFLVERTISSTLLNVCQILCRFNIISHLYTTTDSHVQFKTAEGMISIQYISRVSTNLEGIHTDLVSAWLSR